MKVEWKKLVGKRVLVSYRILWRYPKIFEVKVLEVSPSGKFVKLEHCDDGMTEWRSVGTICLVEILD